MSSNEHDHSLPEGATPEDSDHKSLKSIPVPTIKAILEVPQRGYLRGELIPIKLSINHLRKIQDFNGIIITFVRVCRLDNGPDGVVESFRKDLQQLILPCMLILLLSNPKSIRRYECLLMPSRQFSGVR